MLFYTKLIIIILMTISISISADCNNCTLCSNNVCSICEDYFYLNNNKCILINNCAKSGVNFCKECRFEFYLESKLNRFCCSTNNCGTCSP